MPPKKIEEMYGRVPATLLTVAYLPLPAYTDRQSYPITGYGFRLNAHLSLEPAPNLSHLIVILTPNHLAVLHERVPFSNQTPTQPIQPCTRIGGDQK